MTSHYILSINSGSSSIKFAFFCLQDFQEEKFIADGAIEKIGLANGAFWMRGEKKQMLFSKKMDFRNHQEAIEKLLPKFSEQNFPAPTAVGHRLVHGGPKFFQPTQINEKVLQDLKNYKQFAPLHLPSEIQVIESIGKLFPYLPQIACFDTYFHRDMPEIAKRYPLPETFWAEGLKKYGFHGISYEYLSSAIPSLPANTIIAHLGNGVSLCALKNGKSVDTTMGFSPAGGCMMGTRSGDLDPGVLLYLLQEKHYAPKELEDLMNYESGLLAVSKSTSDMQQLLKEAEKDSKAQLAIELFCYILRKNIGAMSAALGGLDLLVFTGGIGENAADIRSGICEKLQFLGIEIDPEKNSSSQRIISKEASACQVQVIPTNEDLMIARHVAAYLKDSHA
ncbi:MAG: acetate/propionate family kinase [Simkaniaceae bacterium]